MGIELSRVNSTTFLESSLLTVISPEESLCKPIYPNQCQESISIIQKVSLNKILDIQIGLLNITFNEHNIVLIYLHSDFGNGRKFFELLFLIF